MRKFAIIVVTLWGCSSEVRKEKDLVPEEPIDLGVTVKRSANEFYLKFRDDSTHRALTFTKPKDFKVHRYLRYTSSSDSMTQLINHISVILDLWDIAEDSISIRLNTLSVGYPLHHSDVLKNHIEAFLGSPDWQKHISENGKKLDYGLTRRIMLEKNVYAPLDTLLDKKGYVIVDISTEKHGWVEPEYLEKLGYKGNEIIPLPFMVWLIVEKSR